MSLPAGETDDRRISLTALARWLAPSAAWGEYPPGSPWVAETSTVLLPKLRDVFADDAGPPLRTVMNDIIAPAVAGHDAVAVHFSGGMDSLAVLMLCLENAHPGQRVIAVHNEMLGDSGRLSSAVAQDVIDHYGLACEWLNLPRANDTEAVWPWKSDGPCLEPWPNARQAACRAARDAGATVWLSGDGADEVFSTPSYLGTAGLGAMDSLLYWSDILACYGYKALGIEAVAAGLGKVMSGRRRAKLLLALERRWRTADPEVTCRRYRDSNRAWERTLLGQVLDALDAPVPLWRMDAWLALYPKAPDTPDLPLPMVVPFAEPTVVQWAMTRGRAGRWDPSGETVYERAKPAVRGLLPAGSVPAALSNKETYRETFEATYGPDVPRSWPSLVDHGVIEAALAESSSCATTRFLLTSLEQWLSGARERGYGLAEHA